MRKPKVPDANLVEDLLRMCQIRLSRELDSYDAEKDFEFLITLRGNLSGDMPCPTCGKPMFARRLHGLQMDDLQVTEEGYSGSGYYAPWIVMFSCSRGHVWYRGKGYGWIENGEDEGDGDEL